MFQAFLEEFARGSCGTFLLKTETLKVPWVLPVDFGNVHFPIMKLTFPFLPTLTETKVSPDALRNLPHFAFLGIGASVLMWHVFGAL